jgi:bifunctional N-acetylglucosamine-1-phosphate-uridyltransferase/glucosamine-1-phosphate-acetyltransferase GlmU-like protein
MSKVVAIISDNKLIQENVNEIEKINTNLLEVKSFLQKKLDSESARINKQKEIYWENIISYLKNKKVLPADFSDKKYNMQIDVQENALKLYENKELEEFSLFNLFKK